MGKLLKSGFNETIAIISTILALIVSIIKNLRGLIDWYKNNRRKKRRQKLIKKQKKKSIK